ESYSRVNDQLEFSEGDQAKMRANVSSMTTEMQKLDEQLRTVETESARRVEAAEAKVKKNEAQLTLLASAKNRLSIDLKEAEQKMRADAEEAAAAQQALQGSLESKEKELAASAAAGAQDKEALKSTSAKLNASEDKVRGAEQDLAKAKTVEVQLTQKLEVAADKEKQMALENTRLEQESAAAAKRQSDLTALLSK
ncbi:unnamed protein product, partial [Polarella glacialis]